MKIFKDIRKGEFSYACISNDLIHLINWRILKSIGKKNKKDSFRETSSDNFENQGWRAEHYKFGKTSCRGKLFYEDGQFFHRCWISAIKMWYYRPRKFISFSISKAISLGYIFVGSSKTLLLKSSLPIAWTLFLEKKTFLIFFFKFPLLFVFHFLILDCIING